MNNSMKTQKIWCVRILHKDMSEELITGLTQRQARIRAAKITNQCIKPWDVVTWGLTSEVTQQTFAI